MATYTLELSKLRDYGMVPVVRRLDLLKIRMLSRKEKRGRAPGEPDILAIDTLGHQKYITRNQLKQEYRFLSGNKISIAGLSCDREYFVMKPDNTAGFAAQIPLNCGIEGLPVNTNNRSSGDYIVYMTDTHGEIDESTFGIIPSALFRKVFYMPLNDTIRRYMGKLSSREYYPGCSRVNNNQGDWGYGYQQPQHTGGRFSGIDFAGSLGMDRHINLTKSDIDGMIEKGRKIGEQQEVTQQTPQNRQVTKPTPQINIQKPAQTTDITQQTSKYVAIGRLVNQSGALVGFVLQDSKGRTVNVNLEQMYNACSKHLVSNISAGVRADTQRKFFRGTTVSISNLKAYTI